ncbi:hypothetical protein THIOSC15_1610007 [uncultured Thiomicrorhabdus sp.]
MQNNHPMQRLVQGDVGSGKTVVAAIAAVQAAEAGYQVAIMAPTEILAEQHLQAFKEWLEPLDIGVAWINGRMKAAEKRYMLAQIENGEAQVIVGTIMFKMRLTPKPRAGDNRRTTPLWRAPTPNPTTKRAKYRAGR